MARKIKVVTHHERLLKTTGVGVDYFTTKLGYWKNRTEKERFELLKLWIDPTKYEFSLYWDQGKKSHKIFKKGHAIRDQLDRVASILAGSGSEDVDIDFREIADHEDLKFKVYTQTEKDLRRTVFHNLKGKWIKSVDATKLSQLRADDLDPNTPDVNLEYQIMPSFENNIFKAGFDPDRARQE